MRGIDGKTVEGIAWREAILVVVRWPWIVAHALFAALSLALLLVTILHQRRGGLVQAGAWKSSSLAVMQALDPALYAQLKGIGRHSEMKAQGEKHVVRLRRKMFDGWRLVAAAESDVPLEKLAPRAA